MKQLLAVLLPLAFAGTVLAQTQPGTQAQGTDAPKAEGSAPAKSTHHKKSSKKKTSKTHKAPAPAEEKKT
jgi:hypothetical protein